MLKIGVKCVNRIHFFTITLQCFTLESPNKMDDKHWIINYKKMCYFS